MNQVTDWEILINFQINLSKSIEFTYNMTRFYRCETKPPEHSMVLREANHIDINRKKHKPDTAMLYVVSC